MFDTVFPSFLKIFCRSTYHWSISKRSGLVIVAWRKRVLVELNFVLFSLALSGLGGSMGSSSSILLERSVKKGYRRA